MEDKIKVIRVYGPEEVNAIKKTAKLKGHLEVKIVRYENREGTVWANVYFDGHMPDGKAFEFRDEYALLADLVSISLLGGLIGYRVRDFFLRYSAAKSKVLQ